MINFQLVEVGDTLVYKNINKITTYKVVSIHINTHSHGIEARGCDMDCIVDMMLGVGSRTEGLASCRDANWESIQKPVLEDLAPDPFFLPHE